MSTVNNITNGRGQPCEGGWKDLAPADGWRVSMHLGGGSMEGMVCTSVEIFGATWAHGLWKRHVMRAICEMTKMDPVKVGKLNWRVERSQNKRYHPFTFILTIWHLNHEELF